MKSKKGTPKAAKVRPTVVRSAWNKKRWYVYDPQQEADE